MCKTTCSAKIKIARLAEGFPSYLPQQFAFPLHIRFRVAIAGRVIIRTQVRFSRASLPHTSPPPPHVRDAGRDVSFNAPHFLHGNARERIAISIPRILFLFLQFFARLRSRDLQHSRLLPPRAWFLCASVICNINLYSRLLSPDEFKPVIQPVDTRCN